MTVRVLACLGLLAVLRAPASFAQPLAEDPRVARRLELARVWLEGQRAYDRVPGVSAAVVHDQQLLWSGGFGEADPASSRPANAETLYSICSISKLFTSVAVLQQRDLGRLRLDDPVQRHLPWFGLKRSEGEGEVTIEGLLTHASGLPRESDRPYWSPPDFPFPSREEVRAHLKDQEPLYPPERFFQYSNLGMSLAGEVVAATSGLPYGDYARTKILEPLGLGSTSPEMPERERSRRLAQGFSALDRSGQRQAMPFFQARGIAAAAGYASTATDLARFASWQFRLLEKGGQEVLKATTLREMYRIHWAEPDFETLWGLGFIVWRSDGKVFVGHDGACPGYRTALLLMPEEKIATVFLANANGVASDEWAQKIYDLIAPGVLEAVKEPGKGKPDDPALLAYAGAYANRPWAGETALIPWEDGLAMIDLPTTNPAKNLQKLKKTGTHTFRRVRKDDRLAEELVFEMGPDGRALRYTQHYNRYERVR